jgi:hypothetical protein
VFLTVQTRDVYSSRTSSRSAQLIRRCGLARESAPGSVHWRFRWTTRVSEQTFSYYILYIDILISGGFTSGCLQTIAKVQPILDAPPRTPRIVGMVSYAHVSMLHVTSVVYIV